MGKRLTYSQREVLRKVGEKGRCETTVRTSFNRVSGVSAAALVRMGLLKYVAHEVRGIKTTSFDVELTDLGKSELARIS